MTPAGPERMRRPDIVREREAMARYFFYILLFPPALMNLLLVQTHPSNLARYMIAGYVLAALPAMAVALTDELCARASNAVRAAWCGLTGLLVSPMVVAAFQGVNP